MDREETTDGVQLYGCLVERSTGRVRDAGPMLYTEDGTLFVHHGNDLAMHVNVDPQRYAVMAIPQATLN